MLKVIANDYLVYYFHEGPTLKNMLKKFTSYAEKCSENNIISMQVFQSTIVLRTIFHGTNITSIEQAHQFIDNSLYTAMHAIRAATSRALNNNSPGSLVFNRHMFLNIPLEADLLALQNMRQRNIQINLIKQSEKKWNYDYQLFYGSNIFWTHISKIK